MIGRIVSHYRIVERLGGGGMGVVYRAVDERLADRNVAIKFLRPGLVEDQTHRNRFLAEAKAISELEHPNLCEIHEIGVADDETLFLVMAFYGGGSLRECIPEAGLQPNIAFEIAFSIARGLGHSHQMGVVHRDIKPANVMFTRDGFVKIVDFGLARLAGNTRITQTGATLGTVAYMSPQQAAGDNVDARSDIWSLGVVLYEMLTGKLPYVASIQPAMIYSIRNDEPVPIRQANAAIDEDQAAIVHRCLTKDVDNRYQSAGELVGDMRDLAKAHDWESAGRTIDAIPAPRGVALAGDATHPVDVESEGAKSTQRRSKRPWVLALLAVGITLLAIKMIPPDPIPPSPASPIVTEVRAAVMPVTNHIGPQYDDFALGLTAVIAEMVTDAARIHGSMWVASLGHVKYANISTASEGATALGVNRVLVGELQRFQDQYRVSFRLLDANDETVLSTAAIDFEMDRPQALRDQLPTRLLVMFGMDEAFAPQLLASLPGNPVALTPYLKGWGNVNTDAERAVEMLTSVLEIDPQFARGRGRLALANLKAFRVSHDSTFVQRSIALLQAIQSVGPLTPHEGDTLGDAFYALGNADSAVAAYTRVLAGTPGDSHAASMAARLLRQQRRYDEAASVLDTAIADKPDYFAFHRNLGHHYYQIDRPIDAATSLRRSLALAPNDAFSLNELGAIHYAASEWTLARSYFERSFSIAPSCASVCNVGSMYFYEGNYGASARYFEYALSYCDTTSYDVWAQLAKSLYWVPDERDRSVQLYRKSIDLLSHAHGHQPEDVVTGVDLADFHAMCGNELSARELLERYEGQLEGNGDLLYRVGCSFEMLGDRSTALRFLSDAVRVEYPVSTIRGTPELRELVTDVRFEKMVSGLNE